MRAEIKAGDLILIPENNTEEYAASEWLDKDPWTIKIMDYNDARESIGAGFVGGALTKMQVIRD